MADDKELKDQRVVTMMSPSELEAIDDWMFKNRIRSRGEAIRRLCQMAILADESPLMKLALHVLAHYGTDASNREALETFKSGKSFETDVKKLCWEVMRQQSTMVGFRGGDDFKEAIRMAETLKRDFEQSAKGTHLSDD